MNTPEHFARLADDHELGSNADNYANLNSKPRPEPGLSFIGVLVLVAFVLWLIVGFAISQISAYAAGIDATWAQDAARHYDLTVEH